MPSSRQRDELLAGLMTIEERVDAEGRDENLARSIAAADAAAAAGPSTSGKNKRSAAAASAGATKRTSAKRGRRAEARAELADLDGRFPPPASVRTANAGRSAAMLRLMRMRENAAARREAEELEPVAVKPPPARRRQVLVDHDIFAPPPAGGDIVLVSSSSSEERPVMVRADEEEVAPRRINELVDMKHPAVREMWGELGFDVTKARRKTLRSMPPQHGRMVLDAALRNKELRRDALEQYLSNHNYTLPPEGSTGPRYERRMARNLDHLYVSLMREDDASDLASEGMQPEAHPLNHFVDMHHPEVKAMWKDLRITGKNAATKTLNDINADAGKAVLEAALRLREARREPLNVFVRGSQAIVPKAKNGMTEEEEDDYELRMKTAAEKVWEELKVADAGSVGESISATNTSVSTSQSAPRSRIAYDSNTSSDASRKSLPVGQRPRADAVRNRKTKAGSKPRSPSVTRSNSKSSSNGGSRSGSGSGVMSSTGSGSRSGIRSTGGGTSEESRLSKKRPASGGSGTTEDSADYAVNRGRYGFGAEDSDDMGEDVDQNTGLTLEQLAYRAQYAAAGTQEEKDQVILDYATDHRLFTRDKKPNYDKAAGILEEIIDQRNANIRAAKRQRTAMFGAQRTVKTDRAAWTSAAGKGARGRAVRACGAAVGLAHFK